jgi:hypothetical protein
MRTRLAVLWIIAAGLVAGLISFGIPYYQQHKLDSQSDWLDYSDALNGRETPAEHRP